jgi:transcriptional regulator with XRE-family HTH domain
LGNAAIMPAKMPARSPSSIDVVVGRNVRIRRLDKGLSQAELASRLGVTFQQVQRYEAGGNRIGSGRLVKVAAILGVPVAALFQGVEGVQHAVSLLSLIADPRAFRLAHAFAAIEDGVERLSIVKLVEKIAAAVAPPKQRRR